MQQTLPTSTIQLRADDLDFLYTLVSDPGLLTRNAGLFNALSERGGAGGAVKDVFPLSERSPV